MTELIGANLDDLADLSARFASAARSVAAVRAQVERAMSAAWAGRNADNFRQAWTSSHRQKLQAVVDGLNEASTLVEQQRRDQAQASATPGSPQWAAAVIGGVGVAGATGAGASREWFGGVRSGFDSAHDLGFGTATASGEAWAGARGEANAKITREAGTVGASAGVSGAVGAGANVQGTLAAGPAALAGSASAFAGARGNADARASIGLSGVDAGAHAGAFAGVEGSASASAEVFGGKVTGGVEGSIGIGAHLDLDAHAGFDKVSVGIDVGASLGLGAGAKFNVDFSPREAADDVMHLVGF